MKLRNALLAATVLAAPFAAVGAADAAPVDGLYIGGGVGGNYLDQTTIKGTAIVVPTGVVNLNNGNTGRLKTAGNWGFVGLVNVGYGFGNGLRAEIEGNYRQTSLRKLSGTPFPTSAGGDNQTYGAMANILYEFDLSSLGVPINPYIGAGGGYAETTLRDYRAFTNNGRFLLRSNNGNAGNFAYQGIAGAALPIPDVPGLALTLEYRYFGVLSGQQYPYQVTSLPGTGFPATNTQGKFKVDNQSNHSLLLGVRYNFGQAPEVIANPPPPQQVTHSFLVFFDWDRADLTGRARQIIAQAAQNSTKVSYTAIEVNGYTDTSGTAAYNQRLSVRRAQTVAAELVRDGVPKQAIAIQGFGETRLLVPTAQGVREPQNRRVEIIIR